MSPAALFGNVVVALLAVFATAGAALAQDPNGFRDDARSIEALVNAQYAYLDRFPDGVMPMSPDLRAEAEAVTDNRALLGFAERALFGLADHHAITGSSMADSWAVVPSYADLWIETDGAAFVVEAVRDGSPAAEAGVRPGDRLIAIGDIPIKAAVETFWTDLGLPVTDERAVFAARVMAAGRRDRDRVLTLASLDGGERRLVLPNLYRGATDRPPLEAVVLDGALVLRFNDSLGDDGTIAAFDAAMVTATPGQPVVIDLTDTPSGGNTVVARAIMGWFVTAPTGYQIHALPAEERQTGIPRQWIEQVLPRPGKHHDGPVTVSVGRWTGSMGEGLAIGFDALGARITGGRMAGLRGAIHDHRLPNSDLVLKLPTERLSAVDGTPRESYVPGGD